MQWPHWLRRLVGRTPPAPPSAEPPAPARPNVERHTLRNKQAALWGRLQLDAAREGRPWDEELPALRAQQRWERRLYEDEPPDVTGYGRGEPDEPG